MSDSPWEQVTIDGERWMKREMHGYVWAFQVGKPNAHLVTKAWWDEHWAPREAPFFELSG